MKLSKLNGVPAQRGGSRHELPSLKKKLAPTDIYLQRKNQFSLMKFHWGY